MVEILYCEENENKSKDFAKRFCKFTGDNFRLVIKWKTKQNKQMKKNTNTVSCLRKNT